jgi:hypothetical protein
MIIIYLGILAKKRIAKAIIWLLGQFPFLLYPFFKDYCNIKEGKLIHPKCSSLVENTTKVYYLMFLIKLNFPYTMIKSWYLDQIKYDWPGIPIISLCVFVEKRTLQLTVNFNNNTVKHTNADGITTETEIMFDKITFIQEQKATPMSLKELEALAGDQ